MIPAPHGPDTSATRSIMQGRSLCHSFGLTKVLESVSLTIERGEVVALMGPSGSGKSTLLHLMGGLMRPDQGEIWFNGQRIDQLTEAKRSSLRLRQMGFVFQFGDLIPELTLLENVAMPLRLTGLGAKQANAAARHTLGQLGVADQAERLVSEVSGGQGQRAAVARALVHRPALVLADEPTGSLDTVTGELVLEALVAAALDQGSAVLLVTHEARVAAWASREILLHDGRILTPDQVAA